MHDVTSSSGCSSGVSKGKESRNPQCTTQFMSYAVASLGLVSPGASNDGVTRFFSWKKTDDLFLLITVAFIHFTRLSPLEGVTPTFLPVRPRLSTILCKFNHKIFFRSGVTPCRVSPGAVPRPPPSDATGVMHDIWIFVYSSCKFSAIYTVNHRKGGSTFVTITLGNLDRFL